FLVILVGAGLIALKHERDKQRNAEWTRKESLDKQHAEIAEIFQQGRNLVRAGRWSEAKVKFDEVQKLAPSFADLQSYLDSANKEIPNEQALVEAQAAIERREMTHAAQALAKVSAATQMFSQVDAMKAKLEALLSSAFNDARTLMDGNGMKSLESMKKLEAL